MMTKDILLSDHTDPRFTAAFQLYFAELGITVRDWDGLFREMNDTPDTHAFLRLNESGETVGFLQFSVTALENWFFEMPAGFVREFWISEKYRGKGHGKALLELAEQYFIRNNIQRVILTTDQAPCFYLHMGYERAPDIRAKNGDEVFIKTLK